MLPIKDSTLRLEISDFREVTVEKLNLLKFDICTNFLLNSYRALISYADFKFCIVLWRYNCIVKIQLDENKAANSAKMSPHCAKSKIWTIEVRKKCLFCYFKNKSCYFSKDVTPLRNPNIVWLWRWMKQLTYLVDTVQDFLIKLGIKQRMHLWEK